MKNSTPLLKTLLVAAATMSFYASPARAEIVDFEGESTSITLSDGDIVVCTEGTNTPETNWAGKTFVISGNTITSETWGTKGYQGSWIAWANQPTFTASLGASGDGNAVKIAGSGFLGITLKDDNGSNAATLDMTNVDASSFTGQISVVNKGVDRITVSLKGDWSGTEYIFGGVTDEWSETTTASGGYWCLSDISDGTVTQTTTEGPLFSRGWTTGNLDTNVKDDDVLALQGDTTFAGITGVSKDYAIGGLNVSGREYITVSSEGTKLTLAGTGSYEFYGTVGGNYDGSVTRASIVMNSSDGYGKQTFGGTNYLKDVTVTAGTLALDGTTSIAGSVSVASGSTLELGGEITLAGAISNSGTVSIDVSSAVFALDGLGSDDTYTVISGSGSITFSNGTSLSTSNFTLDGQEVSSRASIIVDGGSLAVIYGGAQDLIWNGGINGASTTWTTDTSVTNWTNGSNSDYFANGDNVTFGANGASTTVVVSDTVDANSITVNSDYTFTTESGSTAIVDTGKLTIASGVTLTIDEGVTLYFNHSTTAGWSLGEGAIRGSGTLEFRFTAEYGDTINLGSGSTFTGTVYIVEGDFQFSGSNIGEGTYRFGDGVNVQQGSGNASVTVDNDIIIEGKSELHVNSGGSLTISGNISGESGATLDRNGSGTLTITGNVNIDNFKINTSANNNNGTSTTAFQGNSVNIGTLTISGVGPVEFSGSGTYTVGTVVVSVNATLGGTLTITGNLDHSGGTGTFTIAEGSNITINGTFLTSDGQGSQGDTIALGKNAQLTASSLTNAWGSNFTLDEGSVLTVTGTTSFAPGETARTVSGSGTWNTEKLSLSNFANYTFSGITLNIGSGGIVSEGNNTGWTNNHLTFGDRLTVGVYGGTDGTNKSWSTDATITFSGSVTFKTESEENITLSGTLSGDGFSNEGSGTLTLSGTVDVSSAIQNSGTIIVGSSVVFDLNENLLATGDGNTYTFITNTGGTIVGWGNLDYSNFSINGETLTSGRQIILGTDGSITYDESGTAQNLVWAGGNDGNSTTWTKSASVTDWTNGSSADYFAAGDSVTFDSTASSKNVTIGEAVKAGSITISDAYTFTFEDGGSVSSDSWTINSTLTLAGEGTVKFGSGTIDVSKIANAEGSNVTLEFVAGTWSSGNVTSTTNIQFSSSATTLTNDIVFSGSGAVAIGLESGTSIEISGKVTSGENVTIYRAANNGSGGDVLTFSGEVDIQGGYTSYRGKTKFSGGGSIGTLTLYDHGYTDGVTFSGDGMTYTIGTISFIGNSNSGTVSFDIDSGVTVNANTFSASWSIKTITVNGTLNIETASIATGGNTNVFTGLGTVSIGTLSVGNAGKYTFEKVNLNIGSGGITNTGSRNGYTLTFGDGLTVGVYSASGATGWSSSEAIILSGSVTFNPLASESIALSGVLSGAGELIKTGAGTLELSGTNTFTGGVTVSAGTVVAGSSSALGDGKISVSGGATLQLDTAVSTTGTVTFSENAKLVISGDLLAKLETTTLANGDSTAVSIISANTITFGDKILDDSNSFSDDETFNTLINQYVSAGNYLLTWTWNGGTLSASIVRAIPEPSMLGIIFGLSALGLVATRRRRRKAA